MQAPPWQAAKELCKAAEAARQAGDWPDVASLWRGAALAFATASRAPAAAEALAKGALALEGHDPKVLPGPPAGPAGRMLHVHCLSARPPHQQATWSAP